MEHAVSAPGSGAGGGGSMRGWEAFFAAELAPVPLVVILRGLGPGEAESAARQAWDAGVRLVEVTLESETGAAALESVRSAAPPHCSVGAGTVTTPERLEVAVRAGAQFGVAPDLEPETVRAADRTGIPFLPGVATPTEAGQALRMGITTVKIFPASVLGPGWVKAVAGPFPSLRVIPTGGVSAANAGDFLAAGAVGVGVGSSITADEGLGELVQAVATR